MQAIIRTPREQIFETLNVVCELLPNVSSEGLTFLDELYDAGYAFSAPQHMSTRSKKSPNDKRVEMMKEHPDEVRRFTMILFPTLMHAYTSTVNLSVRQKVLTAQLKMLSNFDISILEDSLRGVAYASHLASILTQQENPSLVTFALQAAELLLKRMETIYRPQFYREGVMAEVSKLADRSVKPEPTFEDAANIGQATEPAMEEPEILEHHDEELPDDEPETIEVDIEPHESDDDERDGENGENDDDHDDEGEDNENGNGDGDDPSDDSEQLPSPRPPHRVMDPQDIITLRAKRFVEAHGDEGSEEMRMKATRILDDLNILASELRTCYNGTKSQSGTPLFRRLAKYFDGAALESVTSYHLRPSASSYINYKISSVAPSISKSLRCIIMHSRITVAVRPLCLRSNCACVWLRTMIPVSHGHIAISWCQFTQLQRSRPWTTTSAHALACLSDREACATVMVLRVQWPHMPQRCLLEEIDPDILRRLRCRV